MSFSVSEEPTLEIQGLGKTYNNDHVVFKDLSFTVKKGEFVSIVGPSGCGKTTLLHVIASLVSPTTGRVVISRNETLVARANAILVFQDYSKSLFPWKTVYENVTFVIDQNLSEAERRNRVESNLKLVGLFDDRNKYPWQLSGGMQQRVAIARALSVEPKILLMDEPFGSVDASIRRELELELLRIWQELKITILFVTHDIDEAIFLSNRVLVMKGPPTKIADQVSVEIPYPRDYIETRNSNLFGQYRKTILEYFT